MARAAEKPSPGLLTRVFLPLFALIVATPMAASLYVNARWFAALGFGEIFATTLTSRLGLALGTGLATLAVLLGNLRLAARSCRDLVPLVLHDPDGLPRLNLRELAQRLSLPASIAIALLVALYHERFYPRLLLFEHGGNVGRRDPIFGNDVGFYLFRLPFYDAACSLLLWLLGGALAAAVVFYLLGGAVAVGDRHARFERSARLHLGVLLALLFAALTVRAYLDTFDVLYSRLGPMAGASYADIHARLPALRVLIGLAAVGSVLVLAAAASNRLGPAVIAGVLYLGAQLATQIYPELVHRLSVKPNELERESPYLAFNIDATRAAYALDRVVERDLSASATLTAADIAANRDTIDNVRLWDHQPLLETFAQIQEIRTYYDFASVDNDRYLIGGKLRQTMASARELNSDSLPNPTWINKRFTFTHGYGLTLGLVNETTPEGLPVLLVQDIPPVSNTPDIKVERPGIYYGELSSDHVFVHTRNHEFDYPSTSGGVHTDYAGKGGLPFDSQLVRIALAVKLGSVELLLSDDIDSNSRVLLYRNILDRLRRIAPFLALDPDPYLVVRKDGTLSWICDAYTTSNRYPYAQPVQHGSLNYLRNSVKAVIDAYDGTVTLYAADPTDPLLRAWRRAFPHSFVPLSRMPSDLRAHLRYPQLIFGIQTEMFTVYHMRAPDLLYNREDQWEVPAIAGGDGKTKTQPYYTVMKLPGESHAEFILMLPFTPKRKDNLAAWMVARSDGAALGQLMVYRFPKDRLVFGPQQVVNRINQDAEISRQISLWDQHGSQAIFGTLLVVPVEESLLYVRPLYLRSEGGKIPELKRVIVAYEKHIAMRPSLREAVEAILRARSRASARRADAARPGHVPTRERAGAGAGGEHTGGGRAAGGPSAAALRAGDRGAAPWRLGRLRRRAAAGRTPVAADGASGRAQSSCTKLRPTK